MLKEIHYRLPTKVRGAYPGFHHSATSGAGYEFRGYALLLRSPEPRRVDLRASLRNPFGDLLVRVFNQRSAIPVTVVADLSASMGVPGPRGKLALLSRFTRLLGYSVARTGDRFGFIGCDQQIRPEFLRPLARLSGFTAIAEKLDEFIPTDSGSEGLVAVDRYLVKKPGLVFLVSDFLFPDMLLMRTLERLGRHFIVPVMLSHAAEIDGPSGSGFVRAVDSETGHARMLLLRPSLRRRIRTEYLEHKSRLERLCASQGLKPLILGPQFTANDVTGYFYPEEYRR